MARTLRFERKAKHPLTKTGGLGWDKTAFGRACRWAVLTGDPVLPVLYAVRDLDAAPLPAPGQADDPLDWWFTSTRKLLHAPTKVENGPRSHWGRRLPAAAPAARGAVQRRLGAGVPVG